MLGSRVGTSAPRRLVAGCAALLLALTVGTACGTDSDGDSPGKAAAASTESFVSILRKFHLDYDPHRSPGELGNDATLTVVGTVKAIDDGRVFGAGPTRDTEPVFLNATLTVRVESVLAGEKSLIHNGVVYVELPRTKATPVSTFQRAMPTNQRLVLFLDDYTEGLGTFPLIEKAPTIPAGETVFAPYAEGLLLEDNATGKVVGGFEPLDDLTPAWRQGATSVKAFTAEHFPTK